MKNPSRSLEGSPRIAGRVSRNAIRTETINAWRTGNAYVRPVDLASYALGVVGHV